MVVQGQLAKEVIHYKSWTTCGVQDLEVMEMPFGSSSLRKGRQIILLKNHVLLGDVKQASNALNNWISWKNNLHLKLR